MDQQITAGGQDQGVEYAGAKRIQNDGNPKKMGSLIWKIWVGSDKRLTLQ